MTKTPTNNSYNIHYCISFSFIVSGQVAYNRKDAIYTAVRQLLSLPYLPHDDIARSFGSICRRNSDAALEPLYNYVKRTWLESSLWTPASWSVYRKTVRTNNDNDVEGWHRRLNNKATRGQLQFYLLVPLLHKEASMLPLQYKLVTERKLQRRMYVFF